MSQASDRKAAIRAYKERKPRPGAYAVRHCASGRAWVDTTPNVDTRKNGVWNCLNEGRHLDKDLQAAWQIHGESAFVYEVLEVIEEPLEAVFLKDALKALKARWAERLARKGTKPEIPPHSPQ